MTQWESFELECTEYLSRTYGQFARFQHQGGADSTVPDILVETCRGERFYMEAKHSPAQCGQFVLLPDLKKGRFTYSERNAKLPNAPVYAIMAHMDRDFDAFREAGTAGKAIHLPDEQQLFARWIVETYGEKGVRFFIANGGVIFPLEKVADYFTISATYRIKRSGSTNVGQKHRPAVAEYIRNHYASVVTELYPEGTKLFVRARQDLHDRRFLLGDYEYMFSRRGEAYEIRRLSNTYNANVIFSVHLKQGQDCGDLQRFEAALQGM